MTTSKTLLSQTLTMRQPINMRKPITDKALPHKLWHGNFQASKDTRCKSTCGVLETRKAGEAQWAMGTWTKTTVWMPCNGEIRH